MTPAIHQKTEATPEQVAQWAISWPGLLLSPLENEAARNEVAAALEIASIPCDRAWLMARILALLAPYFTSDVPQSIRMIEAEDWLNALKQYPAWAVTNAARWWKSDENPDRRKKPLEGDIADICRLEMGFVRCGKLAVNKFDRRSTYIPKPPEPPRKILTAEERRAIAVAAGLPDLRAIAKPFPAAGEAK